jgi:hypothetical protein
MKFNFMKKYDKLQLCFHIFLFITLILAFCIFIKTYIFNDYGDLKFYITWQFPILLAVFLDSIYIHDYYKKYKY